MQYEIIEERQRYKIGRDRGWIDKTKGTGRLLTHLLSHQGKLVSLETIGKITGWDNPIGIIRRFILQINNRTYYEIESITQDDEIYYRMTRK